MDRAAGRGVDNRGAVFQGVEHKTEAAVGAEAHRAEALLQLDHPADGVGAGVDHGHGAVLAIGDVDRAGQR
ncbi:hypothetical protein D3C78_1866090 [compost metagenome]